MRRPEIFRRTVDDGRDQCLLMKRRGIGCLIDGDLVSKIKNEAALLLLCLPCLAFGGERHILAAEVLELDNALFSS